MNFELFSYHVVRPLWFLGITHPFFDVHLDTLIYTWLAMAALFCVALVIRWHIVQNRITPFFVLIESAFTFFMNLTVESLGFFNYNFFAFSAAIFLFTLACNFIGLFPFCDEPTKDLNTTLALGLSSFSYVQYNHIKFAGIYEYLLDYTRPIIFVTPIEIISKLASIVSMSFRLFGNILGGSIVYMLAVRFIGIHKEYYMIFVFAMLGFYLIISNIINLEAYPKTKTFINAGLGIVFFLATLQMFFGVFEGLVQAFVLAMLTLTYLSIALANVQKKVQNS